MPTYDAAPPEVEEYAADLRLKFHGQLDEAGVRIHYIMARATRNEDGDRVGVAIKLHGVRALAKVKINSLADRAEGKADCTITIDGDEWPDWSEDRRIAVIDHELQHVEVVFERDSVIDHQPVWKTDDLGRPVLRLRPHDFDVRGFDVIRARHGMASVEHEAVERLKVRPVQSLLPFARRDVRHEIHLGEGFGARSGGDDDTRITLSAGGKSVTMTGEEFDEIHLGEGFGARSGGDDDTRITLSAGGKSVTMTGEEFDRANRIMAGGQA